MRKLSDMQPMNSNERFLYEIIVRQNIIIEQLSSIVEHIAKKDGVAVESGIMETKQAPVVDEEILEGVDKELAQVEKPKARRTRKKAE